MVGYETAFSVMIRMVGLTRKLKVSCQWRKAEKPDSKRRNVLETNRYDVAKLVKNAGVISRV
jgi:hypothetical protein